jgi:hypothetical protein
LAAGFTGSAGFFAAGFSSSELSSSLDDSCFLAGVAFAGSGFLAYKFSNKIHQNQFSIPCFPQTIPNV